MRLDIQLISRIAVAYALFVVAVIVTASVGGTHATFGFVTRLPFGDKLGHFGLMGMLALLADLAVRGRSVKILACNVPLAPAVVAVLVSLEELSQLWMPERRTFDLFDLLADAVGIVVFVGLGRVAQKRWAAFKRQ